MIAIDEKELYGIGFESNVMAGVVNGEYLVLVIKLDVSLGLSSTGKMQCLANTGGFQRFPNGLKGNVYIGKMV